MPHVAPQSLFPRDIGLIAGVLAAGLLLAISVTNLLRSSSLQSELDRDYALGFARNVLTRAVATPPTELRPLIAQLLGAGLGLSYLAVHDHDGSLLAEAGVLDAVQPWLMNDAQRRRLRDSLYRSVGEVGSLSLDLAGRRVGQLDFALSTALVRNVHERALEQLRMTGWLGLAISLPLLGGFLLMLYRRRRGDARLAARLAQSQLLTVTAREPTSTSLATDSLLDIAGLCVVLVDAQANVRQLNHVASAMTGWRQTDASGQRVHSVVHALDSAGAPQLSAAERALREVRDITPQACELRARDGSVRPVEMSATLLRGAGERVEGAAMLLRDTSVQRVQMQALQREARLSQGVIDHLDEGILTTDPVGVMRSANARILRMFGYSRAELEGATVTKLMPVPFLNAPGIRLSDYVASRNAGKLPKVVGWRKDATTFPVELLVQPMNVEGDAGLVVVVRDITERLRGDNLASRLGRLLDSAAEEVYIFDAQTLQFLEVNRSARRNLGYQPDELGKMTPLQICRGIEPAILENLLARLRGGETDQLGYRAMHRRADGSEYEVDVRLNFSRDEEPPVFMAIVTDLSNRLGAPRN